MSVSFKGPWTGHVINDPAGTHFLGRLIQTGGQIPQAVDKNDVRVKMGQPMASDGPILLVVAAGQQAGTGPVMEWVGAL